MEKIELTAQKVTTNPVVAARNIKRGINAFFVSNINSVFSFFIVLTVVFVCLARVKILPNVSVREAATTCFFLFVCSYFMYCNLLNSGTKLGKEEPAYISVSNKHATLKAKIKACGYEKYLTPFCESVRKAKFVRDRKSELERVGISYEDYVVKYEGKTKTEILNEFPDTPKAKIKAIKKANAVKLLVFTKDMIYRESKTSNDRAILGLSPQTKRNFRMVWNIAITAFVTFMSYSFVIDVIEKPTWASFTMCLVKLLPLFVCGWRGFTNGFDYIAVETVSYMTDQNDLLEEAIAFAKEAQQSSPVPINKEDNSVCLEDLQNPNLTK